MKFFFKELFLSIIYVIIFIIQISIISTNNFLFYFIFTTIILYIDFLINKQEYSILSFMVLFTTIIMSFSNYLYLITLLLTIIYLYFSFSIIKNKTIDILFEMNKIIHLFSYFSILYFVINYYKNNITINEIITKYSYILIFNILFLVMSMLLIHDKTKIESFLTKIKLFNLPFIFILIVILVISVFMLYIY